MKDRLGTTVTRLGPALFRLTFSLLLLVAIGFFVDWAGLTRALGRLDAPTLLFATLLLIAQSLTIAARWQRIAALCGISVGFSSSARWVLVGQFLNLALPTSIGGDAFRVWALQHHGGTKPTRALLTVVIERVSGLVMLALLVSICALWLGKQVPRSMAVAMLVIGPATAAAFLVGYWLFRRVRPSAPDGRTSNESLSVEARAVRIGSADLAGVGALGITGSALGLLAAAVIARGLDLDVAPPVVMALAGTAALVAVLPVSFGGWGVREASMVGLFAFVGAPAEPVIVLSLVWSLLPVLIAAPVAGVWLVSGDPSAGIAPRGGP